MFENYDSGIGKYIKIREFIDGKSRVNESVLCETKWFKN